METDVELSERLASELEYKEEGSSNKKKQKKPMSMVGLEEEENEVYLSAPI